MVFNPFADTSVYLGDLQLPHVTDFSPGVEWEQTEKPIERGALIVDHRRRRPRSISISGYVTGQIEVVPTTAAGPLVDSESVRREIERLADSGETFTVRWMRRRWPNMAITAIEESNIAAEQREDMWSFTLSLLETRVASSTTVTAGAIDDSIADLTASPADGGPQAGTAVGPEVAGDVTGALGGGV